MPMEITISMKIKMDVLDIIQSVSYWLYLKSSVMFGFTSAQIYNEKWSW